VRSFGSSLFVRANSFVSLSVGSLSMMKPTLLAFAISCRLQASPSLESIAAVTALVLLRAKPSFSRAWGIRTDSVRFSRVLSGVLMFSVSIRSPAAAFPKGPVTATMSPGLAPPRSMRSVFLAVPNNAMLIMRSEASPVSPPMMYASYSRAPAFSPLPISSMSFSVSPVGSPSETRSASGFAPFAAKSLMFITTALRAACQRVIVFGTSVFASSMSVLRIASLLFPRSMAATSSPNGIGIFGISTSCFCMISIIRLSPSVIWLFTNHAL